MATPLRFSSFEFPDSIHLPRRHFDACDGLRADAGFDARAPSQRLLDAGRRVSVSRDVVRTVGPRASGPVLPSDPVCDACTSASADFHTCYVNVHDVRTAGDQEEVNT